MNVKALMLATALVIPTAGVVQAATLSDGSPAYCPKPSIPPLGRLICNTPQLWPIDNSLNVTFDTYVAAIPDADQKNAARRAEGQYVLQVQAKCLTQADAVSCVQAAYRKRIVTLGGTPQSPSLGGTPQSPALAPPDTLEVARSSIAPQTPRPRCQDANCLSLLVDEGMSEANMIAALQHVPTKIEMNVCGQKTLNSFPCKVYFYGNLTVFLEKSDGVWLINSWTVR